MLTEGPEGHQLLVLHITRGAKSISAGQFPLETLSHASVPSVGAATLGEQPRFSPRRAVVELGGLGTYLCPGRHREMWGHAELRHFAINVKHHGDGQRVVHPDGRRHALPHSGAHFNGADGSRSRGLESDHVKQVLLGRLVEECHLGWRKKGKCWSFCR